MKNISVYKLQMVKESAIEYQVNEPNDAADILRALIGSVPEEFFFALALDGRGHVIAAFEISHGDSSGSIVSIKSVFSRLLLCGTASRFIVGHNHPSQSLDFSSEDIDITRRLADAGKILGLPLVDHIVINDNGFSSAMAQGLI